MNLMKPLLLTTISLALFACGKTAVSSDVSGRYEETTAGNMASFEGGQVVPAEYERSQGVIISLPAIQEFGKESMAADFFDAGIKHLWISVPSSFNGTLSSPVFSRLRAELGTDIAKVSLVKQKVSGPVTVWARDWAPMTAVGTNGDLRFIDFNYYPNRPADDSTARSLLNLMPWERVSVPVYNEGGNFMNNSRGDCLMTTRVTDANAKVYFADDMILNAAQIKEYYKRFAGCKQVEVFPRIPYEGTGHIDMWAKFLDDDTVIVNEIRNEIVNLPTYSSRDRAKVVNIKNYLESRAQDIARLGYKVIRIPMPAPLFSPSGDLFRSYTNSLALNGISWVPRYTAPLLSEHSIDGEYPDAEYTAAYERESLAAYRQLGYETRWANADDLIAYGGAIHCITMQVAE